LNTNPNRQPAKRNEIVTGTSGMYQHSLKTRPGTPWNLLTNVC